MPPGGRLRRKRTGVIAVGNFNPGISNRNRSRAVYVNPVERSAGPGIPIAIIALETASYRPIENARSSITKKHKNLTLL